MRNPSTITFLWTNVSHKDTLKNKWGIKPGVYRGQTQEPCALPSPFLLQLPMWFPLITLLSKSLFLFSQPWGFDHTLQLDSFILLSKTSNIFVVLKLSDSRLFIFITLNWWHGNTTILSLTNKQAAITSSSHTTCINTRPLCTFFHNWNPLSTSKDCLNLGWMWDFFHCMFPFLCFVSCMDELINNDHRDVASSMLKYVVSSNLKW